MFHGTRVKQTMLLSWRKGKLSKLRELSANIKILACMHLVQDQWWGINFGIIRLVGYPHQIVLHCAPSPPNPELHSRVALLSPQMKMEKRSKTLRIQTFSLRAPLSLQLPRSHHTHTHDCLYMSPSYLSVSCSLIHADIKLNNKPLRQAWGTWEGAALVIRLLWGGPRSRLHLRCVSKSSIKPTVHVWQGGSSEAQMCGKGCAPSAGNSVKLWGAWSVDSKPHQANTLTYTWTHTRTRIRSWTSCFKAFIYLVYHQRIWGIWWTISLLHPEG